MKVIGMSTKQQLGNCCFVATYSLTPSLVLSSFPVLIPLLIPVLIPIRHSTTVMSCSTIAQRRSNLSHDICHCSRPARQLLIIVASYPGTECPGIQLQLLCGSMIQLPMISIIDRVQKSGCMYQDTFLQYFHSESMSRDAFLQYSHSRSKLVGVMVESDFDVGKNSSQVIVAFYPPTYSQPRSQSSFYSYCVLQCNCVYLGRHWRHSHDKMDQVFSSIFAYCKRSKTGQQEGLANKASINLWVDGYSWSLYSQLLAHSNCQSSLCLPLGCPVPRDKPSCTKLQSSSSARQSL